MKKKKKKTKKNKRNFKKKKFKLNIKSNYKKIKKKNLSHNFKKRKIKNTPKVKIKNKKNKVKIISKNKSLISKLAIAQENFSLSFKININFSLENFIQKFFDSISNKIQEYKDTRLEEKRRIKIEKAILKQESIKIEREKKQKEQLILLEAKKRELKEEERLERERTKDIKIFLKKEQALIRKEQAEKQKKFLEELKIEKQIEKFRIREIKEIEKLEKISLREKRDDYGSLQQRIEKLKDKYREIRDQKIRERVEALGIKVQEGDDREDLLQKEREYRIERQKVEFCLESFYRSANSLVFQLNKRHITRKMSIFRCIDRRFETGEIFIKWDESNDDQWLLLIYIKNNNPDEGIIIEDKSNSEKNVTHEFKSSEIFKASDIMVDSLTNLLAKERSKSKT